MFGSGRAINRARTAATEGTAEARTDTGRLLELTHVATLGAKTRLQGGGRNDEGAGLVKSNVTTVCSVRREKSNLFEQRQVRAKDGRCNFKRERASSS